MRNTIFLASAGLNEEQQQIQQMAKDFASKELFPNMSKWDQQVNTINFTRNEPFKDFSTSDAPLILLIH